MYKRRKTVRLSQPAKDAATENWIWDYSLISFVALLIAAALSPVTLQGWHVIIVLHAAILPVAWWVDNAVLKWRRGRVLLTTYLVSGIIVTILIGLGKPTFLRLDYPAELKDHPEIEHLIPR
jgi:hypothetical protein